MHLNIPVELCDYVIKKRFFRPMQLYVFLKTNYSTRTKFTSKDKHKAASLLGLKTTKTVQKNLTVLLKLNWIGYDPKTQFYYLRSLERIRKDYTIASRLAVEFDDRDIKKFKAFLIAAKIGYMINLQKRKMRAAECKKGLSSPAVRNSSGYYPLANRALSKMLNISDSTAHLYKQMAKKAGFIDIRHSLVATGISTVGRGFDKSSVKFIRKLALDVTAKNEKIRIRGQKIYLQQNDMVKHFLRFTRRKKIDQYKGG